MKRKLALTAASILVSASLAAPALAVDSQPLVIAQASTETTGAVGQPNFGTIISTIRSGRTDLSQVTDQTAVSVVRVEDHLQGENRQALDNAIQQNQQQIDDLRSDLSEMELQAIAEADVNIDQIVAARVEADGTLTLFVD